MNLTAAVPAPAKAIDEENPDIYFSADAVENNQELQTITALGNVEIIRNNLTLKADKVIYNQKRRHHNRGRQCCFGRRKRQCRIF
ncbi:MAG: LptA/OstA family protein [Alphaproteobacteria bacterium]